jgi:serine/threonine protein kinase
MNITPRYELIGHPPLRPLGQGVYGSVWLCQERGAGADSHPQPASAVVKGQGADQAQQQAQANRQKQKLVIKCIAYMFNGEECRRMLREVCLMSTMRHPHVSSALDAWTWQPPSPQPLQLCIVSAFGGCSLADFLSKYNVQKPLPEATARSIMLQLAAATSYLHSVAIIHRDIKSENILVQEQPDGQVYVRLIDFGLARVLAPLQGSPPAEDADEVPSAGQNATDESGSDSEDCDSPAELMQRMRDEDRRKMGFDSDSAPARKAANVEGRRKVTIVEPPARLDSGSRSKRAQMTRHVVTHWYRPPELFVDSNENATYDATVDVWSLGCIFAEIMYRVHPPRTVARAHKWSGVLFCQQEDVRAFMQEMMKLCGRPSDADVQELKRKLSAKDADVLTRLVAAAGHCRDSIDEHAVFSKMPQQARDLLRKSLQFNPRKRISADELYCHPHLGGTQAQLVEMAGSSAQVAATLTENQALQLEDQALVMSHMERLITQACQRVQQKRSNGGE